MVSARQKPWKKLHPTRKAHRPREGFQAPGASAPRNARTSAANRSGSVRCAVCPAPSNVTGRASGISSAAWASRSCGTWLVDPPASTSVGQPMSASEAHQAGSGSANCEKPRGARAPVHAVPRGRSPGMSVQRDDGDAYAAWSRLRLPRLPVMRLESVHRYNLIHLRRRHAQDPNHAASTRHSIFGAPKVEICFPQPW